MHKFFVVKNIFQDDMQVITRAKKKKMKSHNHDITVDLKLFGGLLTVKKKADGVKLYPLF